MTLVNLLRTAIGNGTLLGDPCMQDGVNHLDLFEAADERAQQLWAVNGVLYTEPDHLGDPGTHPTVEDLAHAFPGEVNLDEIERSLASAGWVPGQEGQEALIDVVASYARPHMRAAYYLGLAMGWRAAQALGDDVRRTNRRTTPRIELEIGQSLPLATRASAAERAVRTKPAHRVRLRRRYARAAMSAIIPAMGKGPALQEELSRGTWRATAEEIADAAFELADEMMLAEERIPQRGAR